jgi:hypothetical protein
MAGYARAGDSRTAQQFNGGISAQEMRAGMEQAQMYSRGGGRNASLERMYAEVPRQARMDILRDSTFRPAADTLLREKVILSPRRNQNPFDVSRFQPVGAGVRHIHHRTLSHMVAGNGNGGVPDLLEVRGGRDNRSCCAGGFLGGIIVLIVGIFAAIFGAASSVIPIAIAGGCAALVGSVLMFAYRGTPTCSR